MLNSTVQNDDIFIEGFSREIYHSDHVNNIRSGEVCIYYREGLAIKRRKDLELLNEMVCAEVNVARKKNFTFCPLPQWWPLDDELPEGAALDELIESNNLYQLIDEPTHIRGD